MFKATAQAHGTLEMRRGIEVTGMTEEQAVERIEAAIRIHSFSRTQAEAAWNEIKAIAREDREVRRVVGKRAGGLARAAKLSPERRSEIARQAAEARWS